MRGGYENVPMKSFWRLILFAVLLLVRPARGDVFVCTTPTGAISCTGTLSTPEDVFTETFALSALSAITVQTYGFGGGTNAAGTPIPAGGFDSLVALFSGSATAATILTDISGNTISSADNELLYSQGCPPAGEITVGTVPGVCGDNTLSTTLAAGTYTLLLTDANFIPLAVNPSIFLGPYDVTDTTSANYGSSTNNGAYNDLSAGVFQTCVTDVDCNTDNGNFAVGITGLSGTPNPVPEPPMLMLLGTVLAWLAGARKLARKRRDRPGLM